MASSPVRARARPAVAATPAPFSDPRVTASGAPRAWVRLAALKTLWFNTGTLCNLTCATCYIESSPRNDRLVYLSAAEVAGFLDEIERDALPTEQIGFTGGEPFMNPEFIAMLEEALERGFRALVLTNAMRPMMKRAAALAELNRRFSAALEVRVSLDHYGREFHQQERGPRSWEPTLAGLRWLSAEGFKVTVAGRTRWGESEAELKRGYARLFQRLNLNLDVDDPGALVLFPEMDERAPVPEITTACWGILGKSPDTVMCSSSRMVIKRKGASSPAVVACTLIPYSEAFELGSSLREAAGSVSLNHPHCARFCVLGGGKCSK